MSPLFKSSLAALFFVSFIHHANAETTNSIDKKPRYSNGRIIPLDVNINGAKAGTWLFFVRASALYVQQDAFTEWRIRENAENNAIDFNGQLYLPLSAVPGYKAKLDLPNQSIDLLFLPQSFEITRFDDVISKRPILNPVLNSVFFNYDINYSKSYLPSESSVQDLSALIETGLSTGLGVLTSSASARNLTNDVALGAKSKWLRLETTFTKDIPEKNRTLLIGDTGTRSGMLGRNIYFGGVKYGTNFSLTPGYVSQPIPALTGLSAAPSTVELYINGVLRQTSNVPTGPFAIDNFPILTGGGDARIVVRDLLGRETVTQQSFFTNGQLLATGLDDWSVQAGSVRRDLGTANANYGPWFASGLWRRGLNNSLTLEGRAAFTSKSDLLQIGAVSALPFQLLGRCAAAQSYEKEVGGGTQWMLGLESQGDSLGAYFEAQGATKEFRDLGQAVSASPTKLQIAGNINYSTNKMGALSLGFANIQQYNDQAITTLSANYSARIGKSSSFVLNTSEAKTNDITSRSIGLNFVIALDNNRVANVFSSSSDAKKDLYATYIQNPTQDSHLGWRTLAGYQQNKSREEVGANYFGRYGTVSGEFSSTPERNTVRIGANGGVIAVDGHVFATPRLINSFALAEIKDYGNVGVGLGSNMLTKTNAKGIAFIPNLSPYQKNSIRLNAQDLPISAEIDSIELDGVPTWRSGMKLSFPVRSGRGALLRIKFDDGNEAPSGATVQIEGDTQEFYVARRGEAFVTGLQSTNRLILNWKEHHCKFDITLPTKSPEEIPRLGPLLCKGIQR